MNKTWDTDVTSATGFVPLASARVISDWGRYFMDKPPPRLILKLLLAFGLGPMAEFLTSTLQTQNCERCPGNPERKSLGNLLGCFWQLFSPAGGLRCWGKRCWRWTLEQDRWTGFLIYIRGSWQKHSHTYDFLACQQKALGWKERPFPCSLHNDATWITSLIFHVSLIFLSSVCVNFVQLSVLVCMFLFTHDDSGIHSR